MKIGFYWRVKKNPFTEDLQNLFIGKTNKSLLSNRISHIKKCAFNSKRIVVFSGGNSKNTDELLEEIKQIMN